MNAFDILAGLFPILLLAIAATALVLLLYARIGRLQRLLAEAKLDIEGANNRLAQAKMQASLLANTDAVTGLLVRQVVVERFQMARVMARRQDTPFGIILMQLVAFDHLIDQHGHETGDRLLIQVGSRLVASTREIDTVGRVREHEFAVLLPALADGNDIGTVVAKLRAAFEPPFTLPDLPQPIRLKVLFGWASFPPRRRRLDLNAHRRRRKPGPQPHPGAIDKAQTTPVGRNSFRLFCLGRPNPLAW